MILEVSGSLVVQINPRKKDTKCNRAENVKQNFPK